MKQQVDKELDRLLEVELIEPVPKLPTWVNPIVEFPRRIRPTSDAWTCEQPMRQSSESFKSQSSEISNPTLEEIIHEFNGCTIFTKLDLNKGYHQIELDENSRDLTAFTTHKGIFRYTRLLYSYSATEIYQREIEHALAGIPNKKHIR